MERQHIGKCPGAGDQDRHHRRGAHGGHDCDLELVPRQTAINENGDDKGIHRTEGPGFRDREDAGQHTTNDDNGRQQAGDGTRKA